jgi:hypothetical protein
LHPRRGGIGSRFWSAEHENYHVRRACWVADNMPIPETTPERVALFKGLMPNHFKRIAHHMRDDLAKQAKNAGLIEQAEKHNAKATVLRAAEPEKFDALLAWLPINKRELRKLGENPDSSQADYNALSTLCDQIDDWLRERCQVPVPEKFKPIASDDFDAWKSVVGESIYAHLFVSDPAFIDAIAATPAV